MTTTLVAVLALAALVVWCDARCLADLSRTTDAELRMFPRNTWALVIVFTFPVGPALYMMYAKGGPRRFG